MRHVLLAAMLPAALAAAPGAHAQDRVRVVTSLSTYAAIAREIVGERGEVVSIGRGDENPHFVQPRPSFALQLQRADLFVATGLDLELWVPALLDRANNPKVREGAPGYVTAYTGVELLGIPQAVSRAEGDIHAFGNPHIWADPVNGIVIGGNILAGLRRIRPAHAAFFQQRYDAWKQRVLEALVGAEIVQLLGVETVYDLAVRRTLWTFLQGQSYEGRPLAERVGGWFGAGGIFRGRQMVCYHKEWDYFSARFAIPCVDFVEPKPGIPPTPAHVAQLIRRIRSDRIPVVFSASFYDQGQVRQIAERTGAVAVIVPANAGAEPGTETYIGLVSHWVNALAEGFRAHGTDR
jgi:ABC-type Zn uptake system ZnuABC Zn-binding protein ZnuA